MSHSIISGRSRGFSDTVIVFSALVALALLGLLITVSLKRMHPIGAASTVSFRPMATAQLQESVKGHERGIYSGLFERTR